MYEFSKDVLEEEYFKNKLSIKSIANKFKVNEKTIQRFFDTYNIQRKTRKKELTGHTINSYYVIKEVEPIYTGKHKNHAWECKCICGKIKILMTRQLLSKDYKSCGCQKLKGYGDICGEYWGQVKCSANARKISFNISITEGWDLFLSQNRKCYFTGLDLTFASSILKVSRGLEPKQTASLDRLDSNIGYEIGNVAWVHKNINLMKSTFSENEFISICKIVSNNFPNHTLTDIDNNYINNRKDR